MSSYSALGVNGAPVAVTDWQKPRPVPHPDGRGDVFQQPEETECTSAPSLGDDPWAGRLANMVRLPTAIKAIRVDLRSTRPVVTRTRGRWPTSISSLIRKG